MNVIRASYVLQVSNFWELKIEKQKMIRSQVQVEKEWKDVEKKPTFFTMRKKLHFPFFEVSWKNGYKKMLNAMTVTLYYLMMTLKEIVLYSVANFVYYILKMEKLQHLKVGSWQHWLQTFHKNLHFQKYYTTPFWKYTQKEFSQIDFFFIFSGKDGGNATA